MFHHTLDQISIDLKFEDIQTEPDNPQGKGKCKRFFVTIGKRASLKEVRQARNHETKV
jgi:hypothetical protein